MYYSEGSHAVLVHPFGKNRPEERQNIGTGNLDVMESEILEHPAGKII